MPPKDQPHLSMSDFMLELNGQVIGTGISCVKQPVILEDDHIEPAFHKSVFPSMSFSFEADLSSGFKQFLKEETRTRPDRCTKRHYKWRLRKKWFNRYEKKRWIGREMLLDAKGLGNVGFRVISVKLTKDGLEISSEPVCHAIS